jgi:two-component system CheB/CheR fusion protein
MASNLTAGNVLECIQVPTSPHLSHAMPKSTPPLKSPEKKEASSSDKKVIRQLKTPSSSSHELRAVVGIGASAGGLEALTLLLKHLPKNTGMAFVYVQHLDPTHESMLAPILSRVSSMQVEEAKQGMRVMANTLYVIPPNKNMLIVGGTLRLVARTKGDPGLTSIDNFFRSLAVDQKERSIGIILSGNASDGTLGLKSIKEVGGITFVQREDSAKYPSMPHNAIALGDVDHVLTPEGIAKELGGISRHPHVASSLTHTKPELLFDKDGEHISFSEILSLLSVKNNVNFTQYKPMTLKRRILRRMVLHKIATLSGYADYIRKNPKEVSDLFQDILINVTEFFRDKEVFEYLKTKVFPQLLKNRTKDEPIRMWVAGCATGEEVYSLAIAFIEYLGKHKLNIPVHIFGTDLSESCIEKARRGIYPPAIEAGVSKERLQRFFIRSEGNYQVSRAIRDMCIFAKQNIVNDPPFSHLDLVSCRNVLIYLDLSAQKRIIPMFHYALKSSGYLVLGKSEGIGEFPDLFAVDDKTHKTFIKKLSSRSPHLTTYTVPKEKPKNTHTPVHIPTASKDTGDTTPRQTLSEIDQALLSSSAIPACVVVDASEEVLQLRGNLSPYLQLPSGKATLNLLKIAKEDLMIELRSAVMEAKRENRVVFARDINMEEKGKQVMIDIEVIPLKRQVVGARHLLVIFHQQKLVEKSEEDVSGKTKNTKAGSHEQRLVLEKERLQKQLEVAKEQMRSVLEEQEATNEEFQSANEEILSSNEELQSFNEEIQTTKEELQSTNEELITVNEELQIRNTELGVTNSDLLNVLDSVNVPVIIVNRQLLIRRVTPITKKSFRIISSDVGRSITDIKLPPKFPDLKKVILEVIDTMQPQNEEVVDEEGNWYTLWVRPYLTLDHKIDGAIISLMDINEIKLAKLAQGRALLYVEGIMDTMREPLVVLDKTFRVKNANKAFYDTFKISPNKTEGVSFYELGKKEWDTPKIRELLEKVLPQKKFLQDFEVEFNFSNLGSMTVCVNAHRLIHEDSNEEWILLVMENITERKFIQTRTDTFMSMASHELKTPATTLKMLVQILQKRFGENEDKTLVEYLGKMSGQVDDLTKIANNLLDVAAIRSGKFTLNEELFVICDLAREVVENCQLLSLTHKILLRDGRTTLVKGDRERIGRVFINLIINAIKFSPKTDKVIVKFSYTKKSVKISVQDFGIGIAKQDQKKIFDHSTQVEKEKGQHSSGLGLGLYISSTIISRHGGHIEIESIKGKGSTFSFVLPIAEVSGKG